MKYDTRMKHPELMPIVLLCFVLISCQQRQSKDERQEQEENHDKDVLGDTEEGLNP